MSRNREHVTWQAPDGTWSIGFWDYEPGDTSDPDYDPEWDVEYSDDRFWFLSTSHPTPEAAMALMTKLWKPARNANTNAARKRPKKATSARSATRTRSNPSA